MKHSAPLTIILGVLLALLPGLIAYSFGAGSCAAGVSIINNPTSGHQKGISPTFNTQLITGTLATGGFTVAIDGVTLSTTVIRTVAIKKSHTITVKGTSSSKKFAGFSFRLGLNSATALKPVSGDANTGINYYCPSVKAVGITHLNNKNKTSASGVISYSAAVSKVPIDVIVVVQNHAKKSVYYFSEFNVKFA